MDETSSTEQKQPTPAQLKRAKIMAYSFFIGMVIGGVGLTAGYVAIVHFLKAAGSEVGGWMVVMPAFLGVILGGIAGVIVGERVSRPT